MVVWPLGGPFHRPNCPKWPFLGPKRSFFWPEITFFVDSLKKIVTIMTGHLKDNLFVLTAVQGGLWAGVSALFWAKNGLKI